MGKSTVFSFSLIRRSEGTELTMRSERIESIMKMLSNGYTVDENVGKPPKRSLDGLSMTPSRVVRVYRPEANVEFNIAVDPNLQSECNVDELARCAMWGLSRPPVFRDHTMVCVNMSWLTVVGLGSADGVQLQLSFPMTLIDVKLCASLVKNAAAKMIEEYARPFSISIKINEND